MADPGRALVRRLRRRLGRDAVRDDPAARCVYARDASHLTLGEPLCICLPADTEGVATVLAACADTGVPVVCRGTGTGLSGGAVPPAGTVVLSLRRLDHCRVDPGRREALAGAGTLNAAVDRAAARHGLAFAPDPGSRSAATIGGNVAENAGGPHAVRDGVMLHHIRELFWRDADGRAWRSGDRQAPWPAVDLAALLTGSEGILGVVTAARLLLVPRPAAAATLLAYFGDLADAARAVAALLRAGLEPAALELVDGAMLRVVEKAFAFGLRTDAAGALIVELTGRPETVSARTARARRLLAAAGARDLDTATSPERREALWRARRRAFGGVGRLAPDYVTMDVVVPPGRLPALIRAVQAAAADHGVRVATVGHAGDGNLHPGVMFDPEKPGEAARAHAAADAIMEAALALDGSVTGEHGVGLEKLHVAARQFDRESLRLMHGVRRCCDPDGRLNPGKALPAPEPASSLPPLPSAVRWDWDSLAMTAPADVPVAEIQRTAWEHGLWLPVGVTPPGTTLGELAGWGLAGPPLLAPWRLRDRLLEIWAETGDGRPFHAGRPVLKNVAGLDLVRLVTGNGGLLATVRAVTVRLAPMPAAARLLRAVDPGGELRWRWFARVAASPERRAAPAAWRADGAVAAAWLETPGRDSGPALESALREAAGGSPVTAKTLPLPDAWDALASTLPAAPDWWSCEARDSGGERSAGAIVPELVTAAGTAWWWRHTPPPAGQPGWTPVRRKGAPVPPPPPPPGVPLSLLADLKSLFDPGHRLPLPPWLAEVG